MNSILSLDVNCTVYGSTTLEKWERNGLLFIVILSVFYVQIICHEDLVANSLAVEGVL